MTVGCPNCDAARSYVFHRVAEVPVNSCLLFPDRASAQALPTADIDLAFCPDCGFIFNAAWKPERTVYSALYEETQAFSPTFRSFERDLAEQLISRYGIVDKEIVEIGCGKGSFLSLLCELGGNRGTGYDPSFDPARMENGEAPIVFRQEFFSETTVQPAPDLVCCKMTLEHIFHTRRFLEAVRRIASPERNTVVFFQIPDVRRILSEAAFWDVYYEHCSYFSPSSLAYLFEHTGFRILSLSSGYSDQYLMIEAQPTSAREAGGRASISRQTQEVAESVARYADAATHSAAAWASRIRAIAHSGGRTVLWGSGSKAVAFLSAVGVDREVEYLVDINPHRHGKFVPGSGKQVVGPTFLAEHQPDLVIAMNPIYRAEIARDLARLGCKTAELCALGDLPTVGPLEVPAPRMPAMGA